MTENINYCDQLETSAISLRLQVPKTISQGIAQKVSLIRERSTLEFPENIIYASFVDKKKFYDPTHLANVKLSGWHFEIVKAEQKVVGQDIIIVLIKKIGTVKTKVAASDHRNGNNPIRNKAIRK